MANAKVAAAAAGKEKMLMLCSNNGEHFEVEESVAMESQTLKSMIEDGCANKGITLPNVSSKILAKVIEFCWKHIQARTANTEDGEVSSEPKKTFADELRTFNADFIKVDLGTLFELILAANYLDIKVLLDLTCQTVADMIKVKTPEEIRATFNIENDFTAEEEEQLRRDNQWAFE